MTDLEKNHDLLVRISERVEAIQRQLEGADIPQRCAAHTAGLGLLKWLMGVVTATLLALFGYVLKLGG